MTKRPSGGAMKGKLIRLTSLYDVTAKQIYAYVRSLHCHIRKQNAKIRRLRRKIVELRKLRKQQPKGVVVEEIEEEEKAEEEDDVLKALELAEEQQASAVVEPLDVKAFVDDIKKTAQEFDYQNRYIYEPTSGLYYDPETGYYYNAIYGLHYDGQKGCYMKYNEQTGKYDFYSQVIPEETLESEKPKTYQKKRKRDKPERDDQQQLSADERDSRRSRRKRRSSSSSERERDARRRRRNRRKRRSRSRSQLSDRSVSSRSSSSSTDEEKGKRRRKKKEKEEKKRKKKEKRSKTKVEHSDENKEEGELDSSSGGESDKSERKVILLDSSASERENSGVEIDLDLYAEKQSDISRRYPPSLRLIVQESSVASLKEGSLFIITCKGGSLGREGDHDVIIPDINVSKYHLKFTYNSRTAAYQLLDLGSRNGTLLNGTRMAPTMQESDLFDIVHGDVIDLNRTKLLCHIHEGNLTCGNCEPGLLMKAASKDNGSSDVRITKPVSYEEGKRLLQRRYGLEEEKYVKKKDPTSAEYNDRAAHRRKVKGSSNEHAKTEVASLNQQISSKNKGFEMLSKLGWSEGRSLGVRDQGLMEPIRLTTNIGTSGLGSQALADPTALPDEAKMNIWRMAQQRYKACPDVEEDGVRAPAASMEKQISSENRGFQMLSKLGWVSGETLGKEGDGGLKEPIKLLTNVGTSGLGSQPLKKPGSNNAPTAKNKTIWKKKQSKCRTINMFEASDSE